MNIKADSEKIKNDLIYQDGAMTVKVIFNTAMDDEFNTLKDFILKEMNFIEGFKSVNTKENNPLYCQVCREIGRAHV